MIAAEEMEGASVAHDGMEHHGIVAAFDGWLADLVERDGSDLHVKVGTPPKMRLSGELLPSEHRALTHDECEAIAAAIIPPDRAERFANSGEVDFAYSLPHVGRFRTNVFRQRGSASVVLRKLRFGGPTFAEMGCPRRSGRSPRSTAASCS